MRQLAQRITARYHLTPLDRVETEAYVRHRTAVAGAVRLPFSRLGLRAIYQRSNGIPRLINVMAHKSMLLAYGEGVQQITASHVRTAATDTPAARQKRWWWLGFAMLVVSAGGAGWALFK